jgi:two-component system cell cycle response regulator
MANNEDENTAPVTRLTTDDHPGVPQLVVVGGPDIGTAYRLAAAETVIGRDEGADFRLPHPSVSRRHARLAVDEDGVWIEDLGSRNGTFVGLQRVTARTPIREGDHVGLGIYTFLKLTRFPSFGEIIGRAIADEDAGAGATKIGSRDHLLRLLRAEYAYARRHHTPLSLLLVQADALSEVRDTGAEALVEDAMGHLGAAIDGAIRTEDCLTRISADVLMILAREGGDEAERLAQRVRTRVDTLASRPGSALVGHTVTIVVLPVQPIPSSAMRQCRGAMTPNEIITIAQSVAGPFLRASANRILRLQTLTI